MIKYSVLGYKIILKLSNHYLKLNTQEKISDILDTGDMINKREWLNPY